MSALGLSRNRIGDAGINALAGALASDLIHPTDLYISSNLFGTSGALALASALMSSAAMDRLRRLSLADNRIGDEGALALARALRNSRVASRLRLLNLDNNSVGDRATVALAQVVHERLATFPAFTALRGYLSRRPAVVARLLKIVCHRDCSVDTPTTAATVATTRKK